MSFTENKVPGDADFISTLVLILSNYLLSLNLFSSLNSHNLEAIPGDETHITILIKTIVFSYIKIRFHDLLKRYSEKIQGSVVRKVLNKLILFNHQ